MNEKCSYSYFDSSFSFDRFVTSDSELKLAKKPSKTATVYFLMEKLLWDAKSIAKLLNIKENTVWGYKARADKYIKEGNGEAEN